MSPCGWPGRALLLLRLGVVAILTQDGILSWMGALQRKPISLHIVAASAGVFLLLGLWTPVAGAIVALSDMDGSHRLCSPAVHHPPRNARHRSRISGTGLSVHRRLHVWQKAYQFLSSRATFHPSKEGIELNPVGNMRYSYIWVSSHSGGGSTLQLKPRWKSISRL